MGGFNVSFRVEVKLRDEHLMLNISWVTGPSATETPMHWGVWCVRLVCVLYCSFEWRRHLSTAASWSTGGTFGAAPIGPFPVAAVGAKVRNPAGWLCHAWPTTSLSNLWFGGVHLWWHSFITDMFCGVPMFLFLFFHVLKPAAFTLCTAAEQRSLVFMECEVIIGFFVFQKESSENHFTNHSVQFIAWRHKLITCERHRAHGWCTIMAAFLFSRTR